MSGDKGDVPGKAKATLGFKNLDHRETRRHQRWLGILGEGKLAFRPFKHQTRQVLCQGIVDFIEKPARRPERSGKSAAHADYLRTLAREHKCPLHPERVSPFVTNLAPAEAGTVVIAALPAVSRRRCVAYLVPRLRAPIV